MVPLAQGVAPDALAVDARAVAAPQVLQKPAAAGRDEAGVPPGQGGIGDGEGVAFLASEQELGAGQLHRPPREGGVGGAKDHESRHGASRI
jgi:hypothetical protein